MERLGQLLPLSELHNSINIHLRKEMLMTKNKRLFTSLKTNMDIVVLAILASLIIIFGGIGEYLAEHQYQGANITNLGDAFWWAVVTISTVGYGDYYPVTAVGRIIAVIVMVSGIGIFLLLVGKLSQRRLQRGKLSQILIQPRLLDDETKRSIKNKIDGIEKMTEEDFDTLIIMMKRVLEESRLCSKCMNIHHRMPKFCSNCGLDLT
jgi:voltage-gated potassium channel